MEGIELNKQTIEAVLDNATKILLELDETLTEIHNLIGISEYQYPLHIGQEYFVQEEFHYSFDTNTQVCGDLIYKNKEPDLWSEWTSADKMPEKHSRIKFKILNIEVKRLYDLNINDMEGINNTETFRDLRMFEFWYKQQYQNYKDNPFVFIVEIERIN